MHTKWPFLLLINVVNFERSPTHISLANERIGGFGAGKESRRKLGRPRFSGSFLGMAFEEWELLEFWEGGVAQDTPNFWFQLVRLSPMTYS